MKFRLFLPLLLTALLSSNFLQAAAEFLPAAEAFKASVSIDNQQPPKLVAHWDIAKGYYLYQSRISLKINDQQLQPQFLSQAEKKDDPNFGQVEVF